jgi:hypothetical protein
MVNFESWFNELTTIADADSYELRYGQLMIMERRHWENLHRRGLTPQQAWDLESRA